MTALERAQAADRAVKRAAQLRAQRRWRDALAEYQEALRLRQPLGDRRGEAYLLNIIGNLQSELGERAVARESLGRALALWREMRDQRAEAAALHDLGVVCSQMGEKLQAVDFFRQALALRAKLPDRRDEAATAHNLGVAFSDLADKRQALDCFERARALWRAANDRGGEVATLNAIASIYSWAGQKRIALRFYQEAAPLRRAANDRNGEAYTLNNIGACLTALGEKRRAREHFHLALSLWRALDDRGGQALALTNLGVIASELDETEQALDYLRQALALRRAMGDRRGEAWALNHLGFVEARRGEQRQAMEHLAQALAIFGETQTTDGEAATLSHLMLAWKLRRQTAAAILYGKLAVNTYQRLRAGLQSVSQEMQQSFLQSKEQVYRELAELLAAEGRLPEAQQVLRMLKEEEFFDFVRQDAERSAARRATMTTTEAEAEKRQAEIASQIVALSRERNELRNRTPRSGEEDRRLARLEQDLRAANAAFQTFLDNLTTELNAARRGAGRGAVIAEAEALMADLGQAGPGAVALYTVAGAEKYRVILYTPEARVAREFPIGAAELNRKILAFREALVARRPDFLPLAQELWRILIGPVSRDLQATGARTLLWSLDGSLRYLPLAALHDGDHYLVERYSNVIITLASYSRLKDQPSAVWRGLGLGVSKPAPGFSPLSHVADELRAIVRAEGATEQTGVLEGRILLDEAFTAEAMQAELRRRYPAVHIASHFKIAPGNETDSFLLLGDGAQLTLAEIKTWPGLFNGVDLLTLSACDTGVGGDGHDGREVESFGEIAQRKGAKAVVATLWQVSDRSTAALMQKFYRLRETTPGATKAEALRQAQLALLSGNQFRHPAFWSPFILIGNAK